MLKIAHLITGLDTGGAETMLLNLVSNMDRSSFENIVISIKDKGTRGEPIEKAGVRLYTLGMGKNLRSLVQGLWKLVRILRSERPGILTTWLYHSDLLGLLIGKLAGIPHIVWNLRCSDMDMEKYSTLSKVVLQILVRLAKYPDMVMVNSKAGHDIHKAMGYRPKIWRIVPNGFDLDIFKPDPHARAALLAEIGVRPDCHLVGMIARYDPMKDHATFLKAARIILQDKKDVYFVLVGRGVGSDNAILADLISAYGIEDNVYLLGERRDIEYVLAGIDMLVSTSAFGEGFPNILGEAMACAKLCVATDVGDSAFVLGDIGEIVKVGDATGIAAAINRLLSLESLQKHALELKARERIEDCFSLKKIVHQYENIYSDLMPEIERPK